jgi:hypothetical protein
MRYLLAVLIAFAATSSHAALLGRTPATSSGTDYQAYYDTVLNITWLADANLALTNSFGVNGICINGAECTANLCLPEPQCVGEPGIMTWYVAQDWIAAMNAANHLGVHNWRLPNMDVNGDGRIQLNSGIPERFMRDNELGYMKTWNHVQGFTSSAPFSNVGRTDIFFGLIPSEYASSTVDPSDDHIWYTPFGGPPPTGNTRAPKSELLYVWAVSPGDQFAVPIPSAALLISSALAALGWVRRSKRSNRRGLQ